MLHEHRVHDVHGHRPRTERRPPRHPGDRHERERAKRPDRPEDEHEAAKPCLTELLLPPAPVRTREPQHTPSEPLREHEHPAARDREPDGPDDPGPHRPQRAPRTALPQSPSEPEQRQVHERPRAGERLTELRDEARAEREHPHERTRTTDAHEQRKHEAPPQEREEEPQPERGIGGFVAPQVVDDPPPQERDEVPHEVDAEDVAEEDDDPAVVQRPRVREVPGDEDEHRNAERPRRPVETRRGARASEHGLEQVHDDDEGCRDKTCIVGPRVASAARGGTGRSVRGTWKRRSHGRTLGFPHAQESLRPACPAEVPALFNTASPAVNVVSGRRLPVVARPPPPHRPDTRGS